MLIQNHEASSPNLWILSKYTKNSPWQPCSRHIWKSEHLTNFNQYSIMDWRQTKNFKNIYKKFQSSTLQKQQLHKTWRIFHTNIKSTAGKNSTWCVTKMTVLSASAVITYSCIHVELSFIEIKLAHWWKSWIVREISFLAMPLSFVWMKTWLSKCTICEREKMLAKNKLFSFLLSCTRLWYHKQNELDELRKNRSWIVENNINLSSYDIFLNEKCTSSFTK